MGKYLGAGILASGMSMVAVCQARESVLDIPSCKDFQAAGNLGYCDIVKGSGESPEIGDLIEVNYTARSLATGKQEQSLSSKASIIGKC